MLFFVDISTSFFKEEIKISRKYLKGLVGKARSNLFYGSPFPVQIHLDSHLEWACSTESGTFARDSYGVISEMSNPVA